MSEPTQQSKSHFLAVNPDWLAQHDEPILEPELPIIDAHHHLWDRPGWRYLFGDFLDDTSTGHNIVGTVFVQCGAMHRTEGPDEFKAVGETEFANGIAAMSASGCYGATRACAGIVGYADLRKEATLQGVLEAHMAAAGSRFKGIRQVVAWDEDSTLNHPESGTSAHMLADPSFRRGFALLAPLGLSFDVWLYHPQISELVSLARAFPGTAIVLDHFGGPVGIGAYTSRRNEVFTEWSKSIRTLSSCPNVFVKLGGLGVRVVGLGLGTREKPPSSEVLASIFRPYVETCIEAFGADRCMFETNFPVDKASYTYAVCWNAFKRLASGASVEEKHRLFSKTAAAFYRLATNTQTVQL